MPTGSSKSARSRSHESFPWPEFSHYGKIAAGDGGSLIPAAPDLQILYKRLLVAEELGGKVSKDLHIILEQLGNMTRAANVSHLLSNASCSTSSSM
ncbi:hypothetical protein CHARACLAT_020815, partial [Characodon lateralis]|nr:hypothetical protein [Characodon lateralis]